MLRTAAVSVKSHSRNVERFVNIIATPGGLAWSMVITQGLSLGFKILFTHTVGYEQHVNLELEA